MLVVEEPLLAQGLHEQPQGQLGVAQPQGLHEQPQGQLGVAQPQGQLGVEQPPLAQGQAGVEGPQLVQGLVEEPQTPLN